MSNVYDSPSFTESSHFNIVQSLPLCHLCALTYHFLYTHSCLTLHYSTHIKASFPCILDNFRLTHSTPALPSKATHVSPVPLVAVNTMSATHLALIGEFLDTLGEIQKAIEEVTATAPSESDDMEVENEYNADNKGKYVTTKKCASQKYVATSSSISLLGIMADFVDTLGKLQNAIDDVIINMPSNTDDTESENEHNADNKANYAMTKLCASPKYVEASSSYSPLDILKECVCVDTLEEIQDVIDNVLDTTLLDHWSGGEHEYELEYSSYDSSSSNSVSCLSEVPVALGLKTDYEFEHVSAESDTSTFVRYLGEDPASFENWASSDSLNKSAHKVYDGALGNGEESWNMVEDEAFLIVIIDADQTIYTYEDENMETGFAEL